MQGRAIIFSILLSLSVISTLTVQAAGADTNYDYTYSDEVGDVYGEDSQFHPEVDVIDIELLSSTMANENITMSFIVKGEIDSSGGSSYSIDCMIFDPGTALDFSISYNGTFSSSYPEIDDQIHGDASGSQLTFKFPIGVLPEHTDFSITYATATHVGELDAGSGEPLTLEDNLDPNEEPGEVIEEDEIIDTPQQKRLVYEMVDDDRFDITVETQLFGNEVFSLRTEMDSDNDGEVDWEEIQFYRDDLVDGSKGFTEHVDFSVEINGKSGTVETQSLEISGAEGEIHLNETIALSANYDVVYDLGNDMAESIGFKGTDPNEDQDQAPDLEMSFILQTDWTIDVETIPSWLEPHIEEGNGSFSISPEDGEGIQDRMQGLEFGILYGGEEVKEVTKEGVEEGDEETVKVGDEEVDISVTEVDEGDGTVNLTVGGADVELEIGESKDLDTDGDGQEDIEVTLEGIDDGGAKLKFNEIERKEDDDDGGLPGFELLLPLCTIGLVLVLIRRRH